MTSMFYNRISGGNEPQNTGACNRPAWIIMAAAAIIRHTHERYLALLIALVSSATLITAQEYSLTKDANLLPDSDVLALQRIPHFSAEGHGEGVVWDFSENIPDKGDTNTRIWLQKDAIGRNVVMSSHDVNYITLRNDTLYVSGNESPLIKTDFRHPLLLIHYPLSYGDSISAPFSGYGVYCGDHPFHEKGVSTVMADAEGSIVLDDDTISNVLRVYTLKSYSLCMDLDSAALDTAKLKQVIEERYDWYARGYRYPLFTTITSTSYDNMRAIGTRQEAYCMLPDIQGLQHDPYNSEVRRRDSLDGGHSPAEEDIFHYSTAQTGGQITISYSLDADADITALVSDVMGIAYMRSHIYNVKGGAYTMSMDCSGLRYGQYILYMNVNGKIYSNNITVKP